VILEGAFVLDAPQERVWEAIWDIPTLASWIPGCTSAEHLEGDTYRAHLEQQVGFLKAAFDLRITVTDREPPTRIALVGEGEDRRIRSNLRVASEVRLEPADGEATRLTYRHDLSVFGRLGALGFPIIQRKAREAEAEFAARARASLAAGAGAGA
jgi:carbon monoxide dehydrogenase subunit G